ncbi:OmpH family outer membrane protein [Aureibacter tunicatorum]|nr:OmpH family outer membrane protein [Aureibacter tunicatorum]
MVKGVMNVVNVLVLIAVLWLAADRYLLNDSKEVYVISGKLYDGYLAKKKLEKKFSALQSANKQTLDSLIVVTQRHEGKAREEALQLYREKLMAVQEEEAMVSQQYDQQIWTQINEYIKAFGKEKGYEYIYGASGNGSIMYADENMDITEEVLNYMNDKYEDR